MELITIVLIVTSILYLYISGLYRWVYILYKTLPRDIRAGLRFLCLNYHLWLYDRHNMTVVKLFQKHVRKHPEKTAFYFEDEVWSFEKVEHTSNRIANYFKNEGYQRGDTIALLLESSPEYVCIWLGLSKIGVITALINSNLVSDPLLHSIQVSNAKAILFSTNFTKVIESIRSKLPNLELYELAETNNHLLGRNLRDEIEKHSHDPPVKEIDLGRPRDKLLFIYTSGTTGLPKAAVISNMRFLFMALGLHYMTCIRHDDIVYDPLPLYHTAGGLVGVGQCLLRGVSVVIRKKFSASNFWTDCIKYKCTVAQYIGEICRYILAYHAKDQQPIQHSVRFLCGNGLRPQIWEELVKKFKVNVYEFYGATEGNSNLVNIDNKIGAVGFVPRYAYMIYPVTLIKCNEATSEPIRNKYGYCIRCQPGEAGILIGNINPKTSVNDFAGYADKQATEKKVIQNVFKSGDVYFNSGDILVQDEYGYYYFKDRTGDTFRWKGENVATTEIEAIIANLANFKDTVVYGVEIPGAEGRSGMAAIVDTDNSLDIGELAKKLKENLPNYAIPIFLRVMETLPMTGTFKLKKVDLQQEGFNADKIKDKLYFYDSKNVNYMELTKEIYGDIINGKIRF